MKSGKKPGFFSGLIKEWALINLGKYDPQIDADSREKSAKSVTSVDKNAQVI